MRRDILILLLACSALTFAVGCTPSIGDRCNLNTDCSIRGDRQCDVSQERGYCTVFNCGPDSCPESAACIVVHAAVPGCGYDDRAVARTARSLCMVRCQRDTDCREGYLCASPLEREGMVIDLDQSKRVCLPGPRESRLEPQADAGAPVCQRGVAPDGGAAPFVDGGATVPADAATVDAGDDATVDAGADGAASAGDAGGD